MMIYAIKDCYEDFNTFDMSFIGIESETIKDYLFYNYSMRKFTIPPFLNYSSSEYLKKRWNVFKETRTNDFTRIKNALESEYNPIENYDRKEKSTTTNKGEDVVTNVGNSDMITYDTSDRVEGTTEKIEYNSTNTETKDLTTKYDNTDTKSGNDVSENVLEKSGFNNPSSLYVSEKNTSTDTYNNSQMKNDAITKDSGTDSISNSGNDTHTADYSTSKSGTEKHESNLTNTTKHGHVVEFENNVHGNIGITTNQQMIESELDLRLKRNLVEMIVSLFVSEFTFY